MIRWAAYREKWGPLNYLARADRGFALVATAVAGGKIEDKMPWPSRDYEEVQREATLEDLAALLGAVPEGARYGGKTFKRS